MKRDVRRRDRYNRISREADERQWRKSTSTLGISGQHNKRKEDRRGSSNERFEIKELMDERNYRDNISFWSSQFCLSSPNNDSMKSFQRWDSFPNLLNIFPTLVAGQLKCGQVLAAMQPQSIGLPCLHLPANKVSSNGGCSGWVSLGFGAPVENSRPRSIPDD